MKMNLKNKKILNLVLCIALIISFQFSCNYVKADSGWDSDYDSGWDSDYDSGWDSDYDSGWDSGSSFSSSNYTSSDSITYILIILIYSFPIIVVPLIVMRKNIKFFNLVKSITKYKEIDDSIFEKYNIDKKSFYRMVYDNYISIQKAWTNFDYDNLQKLLTDELYNTYISQLDSLKLKEQKNIMSDFNMIDIKVINIFEENGLLNVQTYLRVAMYDYVVDKDNIVIRGSKKYKIDIEYVITFVKECIVDDEKIVCPNCGAPIDTIASGNCEYCGTKVIVKPKNFVMSKKINIGQRKNE